jgi:hypothetical protein
VFGWRRFVAQRDERIVYQWMIDNVDRHEGTIHEGIGDWGVGAGDQE